MLSVTSAYVATMLLLAFKSTRGMGAVALFILLCIFPVRTSLLLVLAAVAGYVVSKQRFDGISKRLPWRD